MQIWLTECRKSYAALVRDKQHREAAEAKTKDTITAAQPDDLIDFHHLRLRKGALQVPRICILGPLDITSYLPAQLCKRLYTIVQACCTLKATTCMCGPLTGKYQCSSACTSACRICMESRPQHCFQSIQAFAMGGPRDNALQSHARSAAKADAEV